MPQDLGQIAGGEVYNTVDDVTTAGYVTVELRRKNPGTNEFIGVTPSTVVFFCSGNPALVVFDKNLTASDVNAVTIPVNTPVALYGTNMPSFRAKGSGGTTNIRCICIAAQFRQ